MKKRVSLFYIIFLTQIFSGCAVLDAVVPKVETPKDPDAFRSSVNEGIAKGNDNVVKKSYVINKPYSYVTSRWKKRANSCLTKTIKTTSVHGRGFFTTKMESFKDFKPSLHSQKNKTVLSIQMRHYGEGISSNAISPPGGDYFMVLDAIPMKGKKTRIDEYRWNLTMSDFGVVSKGILNWANGKSTACPDYQKIW